MREIAAESQARRDLPVHPQRSAPSAVKPDNLAVVGTVVRQLEVEAEGWRGRKPDAQAVCLVKQIGQFAARLLIICERTVVSIADGQLGELPVGTERLVRTELVRDSVQRDFKAAVDRNARAESVRAIEVISQTRKERRWLEKGCQR